MGMTFAVRLLLLVLIAVGLYGAAKVSFNTLTGISPCPKVFDIPACFVVLTGYSLMLIALVLQPVGRFKGIFLIGWLPVFLLALIGSILQLMNGNTCPKSESGLPLCYLSLMFSVFLIIMYISHLKLLRAKALV
jgi:hypothetical protein